MTKKPTKAEFKVRLQSKEGQDLIAELRAIKAQLKEITDRQDREELGRREEEEDWFGDEQWLKQMRTNCGQINTIEKFMENI